MRKRKDNCKKLNIWFLLLICFTAIVVIEVVLVGKSGKNNNNNTVMDEYANTDSVESISDMLTINEDSETSTEELITDNISFDEETRFIFVGDSRYVGMKVFAAENDRFYCENGATYYYLENNWNEIIANADAKCIIIIGLGVNDVESSNYKQYIELLTSLSDETDSKICFMTANPVDEELEKLNGYTLTNKEIDSFNNQIIEEISELEILVIDTNKYLKETGYNTEDGLHYDEVTYGRIYDYIKNHLKGDINN